MNLTLIAVAPVAVLLVYFYFRDRYRKEPILLLGLSFAGGMLSVPLVLLFHYFVPLGTVVLDNTMLNALYNGFVMAAIPEETGKFLFLMLIIWRNRHFDEYYDGILYAVYVSLGFACIENILYVQEGGVNVGIGRAFLAVPGHALDGILMGFYLSLAKFIPRKRPHFLFLSLLAPIIAHGIWDFLIFLSAGMAETYPLFSILGVIAFFAFVMKLFRMGRRRINVMLQRDGR
jgi:protease PrsW